MDTRSSVAASNEIERGKKGLITFEVSNALVIPFVTTSISHFLTPINVGGLGFVFPTLTVAFVSFACIVATAVVITALISLSLSRAIQATEAEIGSLQEKQDQLQHDKKRLFARLLYQWHLDQRSEEKHTSRKSQSEKIMKADIKRWFGVDDNAAQLFTDQIKSVYLDDMKQMQSLDQGLHTESDEIAIDSLLNQDVVNKAFDHVFPNDNRINWDPEKKGLASGIIYFLSIYTAFLGTYQSAFTIVAALIAVQISIPFIGWVGLGISVFLGAMIGFSVKYYTELSCRREQAIKRLKDQTEKLQNTMRTSHDQVVLTLSKTNKQQEQKLSSQATIIEGLKESNHELKSLNNTRSTIISEQTQLIEMQRKQNAEQQQQIELLKKQLEDLKPQGSTVIPFPSPSSSGASAVPARLNR